MKRLKLLVCGITGVVMLGWAFAQEFIVAEPVAEPRPVFDLPLVSPESAPEVGTFWLYSSRDENGIGVPYPFNPYGGLIETYVLPGLPGQYLVADTLADFNQLKALLFGMESGGGMMTMNSLDFPGEGDTNGGGGGSWEYMPIVYGSNDLWLEITNVVDGAGDFIIHTPDEAAYDLFGTTNLAWDVPGLNGTNWMWLLRTEVGQTNIIITNLWLEIGLFRLGTLLDSDSDGLTDAFENLVSHSNPNLTDTDSDGMEDYYEWTHFGSMAQGATDDFDGDGVGNLDEKNEGLNPSVDDTDSDGYVDQLFRVQIQSPQ